MTLPFPPRHSMCKYRVIFEDPSQPDAAACVLCPAPEWIAQRLAEGLTEEQAMEKLVMKDIDPAIWRDYKGNRRILAIVPVEAIPKDRTFRNAWK